MVFIRLKYAKNGDLTSLFPLLVDHVFSATTPLTSLRTKHNQSGIHFQLFALFNQLSVFILLENTNEQDKETWIALKILRGHMEDIYDLAWSPDSTSLISGSVDNTARLWNVQKGKSYACLQEHQGFVQGVTWDPKNRYIATLSTDRSLRVYNVSNQKLLAKSNKCALPLPKAHALAGEAVRLFHDDTLQTFFRRLCFSPDGSIIVAPAGVLEGNNLPKPMHATYIYGRNSWKT